MIPGTSLTAHHRQVVADLTVEHKTAEAAISALPNPRNLSEELTYWVLRSYIEEEYK